MTTEPITQNGETATPARLDEGSRALLFTHARTANTFSSIPVGDDELENIWELARWAPTSANSQPLRVLFVRTEEGKARLVAHMDEKNRAKTLSAPAVAVLAADTEWHEQIPVIIPHRPEAKKIFDANAAARGEIAQFNSILQAGYFILAVRAAGLAAGPMGGFDGPGIDAEFFKGTPLKTILVVNIGHPGENPWFPRLPRLDHDEVVGWA